MLPATSISTHRRTLSFGALIALLFACPLAVGAQAIPTRPISPIRPHPNLVILGGLTISTSATTLNFNLVPGSVSDSPSMVVTTSWSALALGTVLLDVYGYLSNPATALQNTTNPAYSIPASAVYASSSGAGSLATVLTSLTQTISLPTPSTAAIHLITGGVNIVLLGAGSQTNTVAMQIDLSGQPQLPAGTYSGTLTLIAVAN